MLNIGQHYEIDDISVDVFWYTLIRKKVDRLECDSGIKGYILYICNETDKLSSYLESDLGCILWNALYDKICFRKDNFRNGSSDKKIYR